MKLDEDVEAPAYSVFRARHVLTSVGFPRALALDARPTASPDTPDATGQRANVHAAQGNVAFPSILRVAHFFLVLRTSGLNCK